MSGNMGPGGGMRPGGMGPGRGPGMGPGMGPGFGPGRGPGMGPGRGPGIPGGRRPPPRPIPVPVPIPIPPPDLRPRGYDPYLRNRPLNIYLCRGVDTRTSRLICHYTVAYGDAIFPPSAECQMVAGPFYTMLECDEYIERVFGVRRGDYFEC